MCGASVAKKKGSLLIAAPRALHKTREEGRSEFAEVGPLFTTTYPGNSCREACR